MSSPLRTSSWLVTPEPWRLAPMPFCPAPMLRGLWRERHTILAQAPMTPIPVAKTLLAGSVDQNGRVEFNGLSPWEVSRHIPVGLLLTLWERWPWLRGPCDACGAERLGTCFGGTFDAGFVHGVCIGCYRVGHRPLPGSWFAVTCIDTVLQGTSWQLNWTAAQCGFRIVGAAPELHSILARLGAVGTDASPDICPVVGKLPPSVEGGA